MELIYCINLTNIVTIAPKASLESSILLLGSSACAVAIAAISITARAFMASISSIPNKGCSSPSALLIFLLLNISFRGGLNIAAVGRKILKW